MRILSRLASNAELLGLELGGLPLIIKALTRFHDNTEAVCHGCITIWNLAKVDALKKPMRQAKVVTALAAAIDGHMRNDDIQKWASEAMKALI